MKYSVVFPCKDEAKTIGICIEKAYKILGKNTEIIVVDNNSRDKSAAIAQKLGAKVVKEKIQGYGAALLKGFSEAQGDYVIMCDADNTYDLEELSKLMKYKSYDIVIGNRFNKQMEQGAMPLLHKYIGNPILSMLLRIFFKTKVRDTHSGLRIIKKSALEKMRLNSKGMELASEMIYKAAKYRLKIKEVPITYSKRLGASKLHSFRDGWKHLRLMLLYSPNNLYLIPGISLFIIGMIIMILLFQGPIELIGLKFYVHPMFIGSLFTIMGYQILSLWLFSRIYMMTYLDEQDKSMKRFLSYLTLEKGVIIGLIIFLAGLGLNINILIVWIQSNFGNLYDIKSSIFGLTMILIGLQTIFSSFYLSILGIKNE